MCTPTNFPIAIFFSQQDDNTGWHWQQGRWIGTGAQHPRKYRKNLKLQNPKNGLKIFREDSKIHTKN